MVTIKDYEILRKEELAALLPTDNWKEIIALKRALAIVHGMGAYKIIVVISANHIDNFFEFYKDDILLAMVNTKINYYFPSYDANKSSVNVGYEFQGNWTSIVYSGNFSAIRDFFLQKYNIQLEGQSYSDTELFR